MIEVIGRARLEATNSLIEEYLANDSFVVEIGASDASFSAFHKSKHWITVDKYGSPDVEADLDGERAHLPFADNSVDLVICTEVLEHLAMGTPLVREIGRVLRGDGIAIISVPNICSLKSRFKVAMGQMPNLAASGDCGHPLGGTGIRVGENWVAAHVVDFNLQRLRGYLERGGLHIVQTKAQPLQMRVSRHPITLIPGAFMTATLSDFLLVVARKEEV